MPEPVVLAVKLTVLPDVEALTGAPLSPLMVEDNAEAIEELVVPEPLQLVESPCELTVIVHTPES